MAKLKGRVRLLTHPLLLPPQDHIRQSKESKLDELGRHSTKWSEKQQIQMECMSVKYPPPPLSPITRKEVINDEDSSHRMDRYGFHDHVMQSTPPPMKMSHGGGGSSYALKGSVTNIPTNDYEVSKLRRQRERQTDLLLSFLLGWS